MRMYRRLKAIIPNLRQIILGILVGLLPVLTISAESKKNNSSYAIEAVPQQLKTYYKTKKSKSFPWHPAAQATFAKDEKSSANSVDYLLAILKQAQQDELSGTASWNPTPFWGSTGSNPAREIREYILWNIAPTQKDGEKAVQQRQLSILKWFLTEEKVIQLQQRALLSLTRFESNQIETLLQSLVANDSAYHALRTVGLKLGLNKNITFKKEDLRKNLASFHQPLRESARDCWKAQFKTAPPQLFQPTEAIHSESISKFMAQIETYLPEKPNKEWTLVRIDLSQAKEIDPFLYESDSHLGWLIENSDKQIRILSPHGRLLTITASDRDSFKKLIHPKPTSLATYITELEKLRRDGDQESELSEYGGLSGQFESKAATLPEFILAYALYDQKKWKQCARILFPTLSSCVHHEHALHIVKNNLGIVQGHRMLVEFVGNRDYSEAIKQARLIEKHFQKTMFSSLAERIIKELPQRGHDFKELTLPTPTEWETWKSQHSRTEQINYLCSRLRLLNCYQYGQPADVDLFDSQTAKPTGLNIEATRPLFREKTTKVINPLLTLMGGTIYNWETGEEQEVLGMNLTIKDLTTIAPYLKEDWLILSVGYWRSHYPSRSMIGTREVVNWLLERSAGREILSYYETANLSEEEITDKVEEIISWANERQNWSKSQLLLEHLTTLQSKKADWYDARASAEQLTELQEKKAFPLIAKWLTPKSDDLAEIIRLLGKLDVKKTQPLLREFLDHKDPEIQIEAALILLANKDDQNGSRILGQGLSRANHTNISGSSLNRAFQQAAQLDRPVVWKALDQVFDNIEVFTISHIELAKLARQLEAQGSTSGLDFYHDLLENRETGIPNMVSWSSPIAFLAADQLIKEYAEHDPAAMKISKSIKADTEEQLQATKIWLNKRLETFKNKTAD